MITKLHFGSKVNALQALLTFILLFFPAVNLIAQCANGSNTFTWEGTGSGNEAVMHRLDTSATTTITGCGEDVVVDLTLENPDNVFYSNNIDGANISGTNGSSSLPGYSMWLDNNNDLFDTNAMDIDEEASIVFDFSKPIILNDFTVMDLDWRNLGVSARWRDKVTVTAQDEFGVDVPLTAIKLNAASTITITGQTALTDYDHSSGNGGLDVDDTLGHISWSSTTTISTLKLTYATGVGNSGQQIIQIGNFNFCCPSTTTESATLDFDGINDYVVGPELMSNYNETITDGVTLMGWVKSEIEDDNTTTTFIFGEDNAIELRAVGSRLNVYTRFETSTGASHVSAFSRNNGLKKGIWRHVTLSVDFKEDKGSIYIDGKWVHTRSLGYPGGHDVVGFYSAVTAQTETFQLGRETLTSGKYFKGAIDEVRFFDKVLTETEIREIVFQEVENDNGKLKGTITPHQIGDLNWNNLALYYPMTDVHKSRTIDASINGNDAALYNITSDQPQTAPMPFETKQNGNWHDKSTWLHGDVWALPGDEVSQNISNSDEHYTWGIYHIKNDVTLTTALSETNKPRSLKGIHALAVIVDEKDESNNDITFTIGSSSEDLQLNVTKYLSLNGTIDLKDDSQLIQGIESNLITSSKGKILRRQSGSSNVYWYTYMSSPIGELSNTILGDDNADVNNPNNSSFSLGMHKEGNGNDLQFTSAYNEVGKLSTRWTYTFLNGITYYDWLPLSQNTTIEPGVGYIHKGLGNSGLYQEYLFEGRPNNGTIKIAANDVNGDSGNESEPDVTQTTTLIGNPYPSAIDAHKFIDDNEGVIDGTLYFWHQWAGSSHNLAEYEGGYAIVNKMAKIRAYQFVGLSGENNGSQDGTITPTQYISVGQSFMTEVIADGEIEFNNDQRVFKRESEGESQHFKTSETDKDVAQDIKPQDPMQIIKLEFKTSNNLSREIAIGFSDFTSSKFDYGYDGKMFADKQEDIYTNFGEHKMVTQAYSSITSKTVVPIGLSTSGEFKYSIRISDVENLGNTEVYLIDKYEKVTFDLTNKKNPEYVFKSDSGEFNDRFEIVFNKQEDKPKKTSVVSDYEYNLIYYSNASKKLFMKSLIEDVDELRLINMLGQTVQKFENVSSNTLDNGLSISGISKGNYIAYFKTGSKTKTKKIIIN